jgi:hypothetical protein
LALSAKSTMNAIDLGVSVKSQKSAEKGGTRNVGSMKSMAHSMIQKMS